MREHCLRIAELNLKINDFADCTIFNVSAKKQKVLEGERHKLFVMLRMLYPKLNPDEVLTPVNTKGIKFSTDIKAIEMMIQEQIGDDNGNNKQRVNKIF